MPVCFELTVIYHSWVVKIKLNETSCILFLKLQLHFHFLSSISYLFHFSCHRKQGLPLRVLFLYLLQVHQVPQAVWSMWVFHSEIRSGGWGKPCCSSYSLAHGMETWCLQTTTVGDSSKMELNFSHLKCFNTAFTITEFWWFPVIFVVYL